LSGRHEEIQIEEAGKCRVSDDWTRVCTDLGVRYLDISVLRQKRDNWVEMALIEGLNKTLEYNEL
jgi:hypothetical protein